MSGKRSPFVPTGERILRIALAGVCLLTLLIVKAPLFMDAQVDAQDAPPEKVADNREHVARFITISSPVGDETLGHVRRTALDLQNIARTENREAFLVLEIEPGISQFHNTYALAEFLTSAPLNKVKTIAWIPESVTGNNTFVALACNEIVMHPDAELGDLGRGNVLPADQQGIVKSIVAKRQNAMLNEALANSMMDPKIALLQLTIDLGDGTKETRLATEEDANQLRAQGVVILNSKTIKEAGRAGTYSGAQARADNILAVRTAQSRRELADAYGLPLEAMREVNAGAALERVAYIELKDEINQLFTSFANRQIDEAVRTGSKLIVFEIDSPGGDLWFSRDLAFTIAALSEKDIRTVAYIPDKAFSGGTIVAVGCDEIYMKPNATIGDAIPIRFAEGVFIEAPGKVLSAERELLSKLAKIKNRPAAILEAFADQDLEVFQATHKQTGRVWYMSADEIHESGGEWIQGPRVAESRPGVAITVDGERAHALKISETPVQGVDELKERLGIPLDMDFRKIERTWVDTLVFVLNTDVVTGLLFFVAVVCIYLELSTMVGVFGMFSVIAFAVFFWSRWLGGTATGLEIVLFVVGLGLLGIELFLIPGFGVFGVTGILLVLGSLIMASQTFTGFDTNYDLAQAGQTILTFGAAMICVIIASVILSYYLPKIPLLRDMVLIPPGAESLAGPRLRPELESRVAALVGEVGKAVTVLRPSGKARIDGELLDVVSDGPYIQEGTKIEVVRVTGNRIVVREA